MVCPNPGGLRGEFHSSVQGGIAGEDQGMFRTCTPCIWPQVVYWWASMILGVILSQLWPVLWSEVFRLVINIFHLLGVLVLQTSSKVLLCVSLEVEPGPCSKAASLTSLISSCLPFETQGRSWRLKPVSYKQEMRDRWSLPWPGAHSILPNFDWWWWTLSGLVKVSFWTVDLFSLIWIGTLYRKKEQDIFRI